jgi:arylsulfatase
MSENIVLVTVDSFRADHCSFAGYDRETTPTLDEMADEGFVFENAIAPGPITPESLPPLFTGHYPVTPDEEGENRLTGARERISRHMRVHETLPERLSRLGYATGGFTPNPWTSRYFEFDRGFDHFEDFMDEDLSTPVWQRMLEGRNPAPFKAARLVTSWLQRQNVFKPWSAFYDDIVAWTETVEEPYFLWVFLLDVHFPYLPGDEYRTQSRWREYEANLRLYLEDQHTPYSPRVHDQLKTAYEDSIRYTDAFFRRLREDLGDRTRFVVHGDHGEAFGEHGTYTHQSDLYDENVHVPLVISGADSGSVSRPVSLRALPELLAGLAETGRVPDVSDLVVTSKTVEGEKLAVQPHPVKYIRSEAESELYDLRDGEGARLTDDELEAVCRDLVDAELETEREERRLKRAAREVLHEQKYTAGDGR